MLHLPEPTVDDLRFRRKSSKPTLLAFQFDVPEREVLSQDPLVFLPLLLGFIASRDARYKVEKRFHLAVAHAIADLKERGNKVLSLSKEASFQDLNAWKQNGSYAQPRGATFIQPAEAVEPELSEAVYMLAWRAVTTLDLLLKGQNLQRYLAFARGIRAKLSEEDHEAIRERAEVLRRQIFQDDVA